MPLEAGPAAIIQAAGDIGSGFLQRGHQKRQLGRQIRANVQASDVQWQREQQAWKLNNQYNSPAEQMKRLQAAGLNPNLVYGATAPSGASGSQPRAPRTEVPDFQAVQPFKLPGGIGQYLDIMMKKAQIELVKTQTQNIGATKEKTTIANAIAKVKNQFDIDVKYSSVQKGREIFNRLNETRTKLQQWHKETANANIALLNNALLHGTVSHKQRQVELQTMGMEIQQIWKQSGVENSAQEWKNAVTILRTEGYSKNEIAMILLSAGVAGSAIKQILQLKSFKALGGKGSKPFSNPRQKALLDK